MKGIDLLISHDTDVAMSFLIMLTDGQPSVGIVTNPDEIVSRVTAKIDGRFPLFSIGFGEGVDFSFLEKLSLSNQGFARKVFEDESATKQMKGFYDDVANPLLFGVNIEYDYDLVDESSLTRSRFVAYFNGTEITVTGKLKEDAFWNSEDGTNTGLNNSLIADGSGDLALDLGVKVTASATNVDVVYNSSVVIEVSKPLFKEYRNRLLITYLPLNLGP